MKRSRMHDSLMQAFCAAIVAVADRGRADIPDKEADATFVRAMQMLADEHREFTRSMRITHCLRVARDQTVVG